ncbi:hypothetical protein QOT17_016162 [Balamuthia mandrillaris]
MTGRRYFWPMVGVCVTLSCALVWLLCHASGATDYRNLAASPLELEAKEHLHQVNKDLWQKIMALETENQRLKEALNNYATDTTANADTKRPKQPTQLWERIYISQPDFGSQLQLEEELPHLTRGVITLAQGMESVEWVLGLVTSLHQHHPDINITVNTDRETYPKLKGTLDWYMHHSECFTNVTGHLMLRELEKVDPNSWSEQALKRLPSRAEKLQVIRGSPYDLTLFMDADVFICRPGLDQLWFLLLQYDVAATITPAQYKKNNARPNVPDSFMELNSGVTLYRRNNITERMLNKWADLLFTRGGMDQGSFREALWTERASVYALPYVYNCRTLKSCGAAKECFVAHWKEVPEKTKLLQQCGFTKKHFS